MKVNVIGGEQQGLAQQEFDNVSGIMVNGEDGQFADLVLMNDANETLFEFAPGDWTAFAVMKEG